MIKTLAKKFANEEDGSLFEYLILIAIAALIAVLIIPALRTNLIAWFNTASDNVTKAISGKSSATTPTESSSGTTVTW